MVSEDSLHRVASLAASVHLLSESKNVDVVLVAEDFLSKQRNRRTEPREVLGLQPDQREAIKERHNAVLDLLEVVDLPVPAAVAGLAHGPTAERLTEEIERRSILLGDVERS